MWSSRGRMRGDAGAAAVEFAMVSVLLLMMIIGIVEFGRIYSAKLAVTHAAREGARQASVNRYDASYVKSQAAPLPPAVVTVARSVGADSYGRFVLVTVSAPVSVGFLGTDWAIDRGTVTVSSSARMKAEY